MSRALIVLDSEFQRRKAADWCWALKDGTRCEFKGPKRTLDQNSLFWVLLTEIATQLKWHGLKLTPDDWKLQFLDALRRAKKEELHIVPNLDNTGFVNLSNSSSDLSKEEMSELIELVLEFGARHGVTFHNPKSPAADNDAGAAEPVASPSGSATDSNSEEMVSSDPAGDVLDVLTHPGGFPSSSPDADPQSGDAPLALDAAPQHASGDTLSSEGASDDSGGAGPSSQDAGAVAPIPGHREPRGDAPASDGPRVADDASSQPEATAEPSAADETAMVNSAKSNTAALRDDMIRQILKVATDPATSAKERLEILDEAKPLWIAHMPGHPTLVSHVFQTAVRVVRGEIPISQARRFMDAVGPAKTTRSA